MKRYVVPVLLAAMLFTLITACGVKTEQPDIILPGAEDSGTYDCYGMNIRIFQQEAVSEKPLGYKYNTKFADYALARLKEINGSLNCNTSLNFVTDCQNYVTSTSASGVTDADIIYCGTGTYVMGLAMGNLLHSYVDSDIIDITDRDKYGPLNLAESCMVDGVVYGLIPMKWPNKSYEGNIGSFICFNSDIISQHNMPNPRELDEKQQWTAVYFSEILPQFSVFDSDYSTYSLTAHRSNFVRGMLGANGMRLVAEVNGEIVEGFDTVEVRNMLQWASDFVKNNNQYINFISEYTPFEYFIDKYCTMAVIETQWIDEIAQDAYNFGLLPFPCGPDIEYGKQVTFFSTIDAFAIPEMSAEPEACEYILDALLEPFAGYETEESIRALLDNTFFFDKRDTDYYASLYENTQSQYYAISAYTFMENISSIFDRKSPSEVVASLKGTNEKNIEEYIAVNYRYIKEQNALSAQ